MYGATLPSVWTGNRIPCEDLSLHRKTACHI